MFDSTNLPLEPRKVIKKSIGTIIGYLVSGAIIIGGLSVTKTGVDISDAFVNQIFSWAQLIVVGLVILIPLCNVIYQYLYYKFYYYNFSDEVGEIRKGVVAQATGHVYYNRIQNIYVDQDIWDRVFRLYDVHYETAGDSSSFYSHVDGLNKENSGKLLQFLLEKAKNTPGHQQNSNNPAPVPVNPVTMSTPTPSVNSASASDISKATMPISPKYASIMAAVITFSIIFLSIFISGGTFFIIIFENPVVGISIFLISSLLIYFFTNLYTKAWVKNYDFVFDNEKGTISSGVFSRKTTIIYYNRIQNINLSQGIVDRLFDMNNVSIETAAAGEINAKGIKAKQAPSVVGISSSDAQKLKDFLLEKTKVYQANI